MIYGKYAEWAWVHDDTRDLKRSFSGKQVNAKAQKCKSPKQREFSKQREPAKQCEPSKQCGSSKQCEFATLKTMRTFKAMRISKTTRIKVTRTSLDATQLLRPTQTSKQRRPRSDATLKATRISIRPPAERSASVSAPQLNLPTHILSQNLIQHLQVAQVHLKLPRDSLRRPHRRLMPAAAVEKQCRLRCLRELVL